MNATDNLCVNRIAAYMYREKIICPQEIPDDILEDLITPLPAPQLEEQFVLPY